MVKRSQYTFFQLLLFLSGVAALIYQVAWQRVLTQAIGVDNIAIVFIVTIFMLGLGSGSLAGGVLARLPLRKLPTVYASIELGIGIFGLFSLAVLRWANAWFAQFSFDSILLDFLVNCALLFGPIFLMGMTTPIAIQILKDRLENFGNAISRFYGANVLGAATGSILCLPMIELLSLQGTVYVAVALNILIGTLFILAFKWQRDVAVVESAANPVSAPVRNEIADGSFIVARDLYLAAFCFGFANLAVQIIAFRFLIDYMSPISYLFPVGLSAYLMLMALGQAFGGAWVDALDAQLRHGLVAFLVAGVVLSFVIVANIPFTLLDALRPTFPGRRIEFILLYSIPLAFLFMLPTFFASAFLPVLAKIRTRNIEHAGSSFGSVLFWSTAGNIAGAFLVGMVLFQYIGAVSSISVTGIVLMAGWLLLGGLNRIKPASADRNLRTIGETSAVGKAIHGLATNRALLGGWAGVLVLTLLVALPRDYFRQSFRLDRDFTVGFKAPQPILSLEGRSSVTSIYSNSDLPYRFEVRPSNSGAAAAITHEAAVHYRYYSLAAPQIIDLSFRPRRILQIGMGSGEFPYVVKELPFVEHIDMVELVPEVVEAYRRYSHPSIRETLRHPKVTFHVTDGRRFMQKALARAEKYDFIQIGVTGLASSGISNMYSTDLFKRLRDLLNPGGYVALEPYVAHARLVSEFFPHGYVIEGSSWIFFHDKPMEHADGANILLDEYNMRLLKAKSLEDMRTPLPPQRCTADVVRYAPIRRQQIIPRFDQLLGSDDNLPFEYFYLAQYTKNFVLPGTHVTRVPGLVEPMRTLNVTGRCTKSEVSSAQ